MAGIDRGDIIFNSKFTDYKNINGNEYAPYVNEKITPIKLTWSNKNRGINLPLIEGGKTFSTIWFRRNDNLDVKYYTASDYEAVKEAITILKKTKYELKRFQLCPDNEFQVWTSNSITVKIRNIGEYLIAILTYGRIGNYSILC